MKSAEELLVQMNLRKKVFIASPYTKPDPGENINKCVKVFNKLLDGKKCMPINMLWTHFFHCIEPRSYEDWLVYCMAFIPMCDAMLVLPGESSGKDREIKIAQNYGIPVFFDIATLEAWLDS